MYGYSIIYWFYNGVAWDDDRHEEIGLDWRWKKTKFDDVLLCPKEVM